MKKITEKPIECTCNQPGGRKISDDFGNYPATSTTEAIERASLADVVSGSISPNRDLSRASTVQELAAYQRFISTAQATELFKNDDAVQLSRIIAQMKQAQAKQSPDVDYDLIPIVMSTLTLHEDIASKTLEFSILTSARLKDLIRLKWKNLDLKAGCIKWSSGLNAKHLVPLSNSALRLLEELPRTGDYIFGTEGDKPISPNQLHSSQENRCQSLLKHNSRRVQGVGFNEL